MTRDYLDFIGEEFELEYKSSPDNSISDRYSQADTLDAIEFGEIFAEELRFKKKYQSPGNPSSFYESASKLYNEPAETNTAGSIHFLNPYINAEMMQFRNGLLQALRQNVLNISGRLRYVYLTDDEAVRRGINLSALQKLRKIRDKVEEIYRGAKGYQGSMEKAILTGIGNGYNNLVPVVSHNDQVYADQSEYDVLHGSYSSSDVNSNSKRVTEFTHIIAATLKQVNGLFKTDSASEAMFQSESASVGDSNTVKGNSQKTVASTTLNDVPSQEESQGKSTTSAVAPPKENKNFIDQTTDWIGENPITSLVIAGTLIGGGLMIKRYFDEQKGLTRRGLRGLSRTATRSRSRKRTGRRAVREGRSTEEKKATFIKLL